jgi:cell division initiation protein
MKLTPLDIRHKDFKRGMRGYADVEVDEFLDQVADEFERLFKEGIDLKERVEALEEKVAGYRRIEETLQKTLISAQASAEELKQNASKEAQLILHEAELKGRQMVNEAYSERQAIEQAVAKLKSGEQDFRFKFRQLLQGYLKHVEEQTEQPDTDFTRQADAIKQAISREGAGPAPAAVQSAPAAAPPAAEITQVPGAIAHDTTQVPAEPATAQAQRSASAAPQRQPAAAPAQAQEPAARPTPQWAQPAPDTTGPAPQQDSGARPAPDRVAFVEADDLLGDVDTGVNENEFKW